MLCFSPSVKSLGFLGSFNPLSFFLLWEEKPFSSVGDSVGKPFSESFSCLGLVSPLLGDNSVFCCANLLSCFETPGKTWCIILTIFCSVMCELSVHFSSVQSLSCVWLFATSGTAALQTSLSITNSRSLPKLMSIESVMPSNHLILCYPLCLLPLIFASIRVFSNESALPIR